MRLASKPEFCTHREFVVIATVDGEDEGVLARCVETPALNLNGEWLCWDHLEEAGFDTKALVD